MKVYVDQDLCIGCEACVALCPDLFGMYPNCDFAYAITEDVPENLEDCAQEAVRSCPVQAIIIED
ncbi:MAG: ferredoxin [Peptococcales bacterium]|jgi:ferredoxin